MISDLQNQLGIDQSFFIELAIFVSLYVWLQFVLFSPYLKLRSRRRGGTDGVKKEANSVSIAAADKETKRAQLLLAARRAAAAERESRLLLAKQEVARSVAAAKAGSRAALSAAREEAQSRAVLEMEQLRAGVDPLSEILVARLMEKRVGV